MLQLFNINTYLVLLIGLVSVFGDFLVTHSGIHLFQAIFDNVTHAIIGGLSWLFVCVNCKTGSHFASLTEIGLCALIASLIDIDHFIAAKSIHLKDATSLPKRPPLHCSTFPLLICVVMLLWSYLLQMESLKKGSLIVLTAFASHHTRDATRRGYWFYPFGSTAPIPYFQYVALTCLIPYGVCFLQQFVKIAVFNYKQESVI